MNAKNILSVVASAFAAGASEFATTHWGDAPPVNGADYKAFAVGALVAGVVAVMHLYQPVPVKVAPTSAQDGGDK